MLCLALVMVGGMISAVHNHAQDNLSHQDCGLCVTAHMAVQVAVAVTPVCVARVYTRYETASPLPSHQFTPEFALFSRPPPADLTRS